MSEQQLALADFPPRTDGPVTPLELVRLAVSNGAAIDVIERLAKLQEQAMARESEIAFNDGMNKVQSEIKRVAADLDNPQTRSKYASYAAIDRTIRPIYSRAGFSLSFDTTDCPLQEHIRVVCYVSLGAHTRRYQVDMPCDGKGAKGGDVMTKTHAAGAAMSYGMRYLVKSIFNVAVGDDDVDGNTNGELMEQIEWLMNAGTREELKKLFEQAYKTFETNPGALKALVTAKNKRKQELS